MPERLSHASDPRPAPPPRRLAEGFRRGPAPGASRLRPEKSAPGAAAASAGPLPRESAAGALPLSYSQERIWFFARYQPTSALYNLPLVLRVSGPLNLRALRMALTAIVGRHEVLRSRYLDDEGRPVQVVDPPAPVAVAVTDLGALSGPDLEAELARTVGAECRRPFDISREPVLRAALVRLSEGDHALVLVKHHIAADGWSENLLLAELVGFYDAFDGQKAHEPPPLPVQYADFAIWQRSGAGSPALAADLAYWRERMAGAPPLLDLPTDFPRPARQSFRGATERRHLPLALLDALQALARREKTTLFSTILGAFSVFLHRACRSTDIVIGTPVAGRTCLDIEGLIGFFVNTLALRCDLAGDPPFVRYLKDVRETTLAALAHQDLPFEKLVEELHPPRNASHLPLVQCMLIFQGSPAQTPQPARLRLRPMEADTGTSKFDLTLYVNQVEGEWTAAFEYNADLFMPETMARMLGCFQCLLESIAADPTRRLSELALLNAEQRTRILADGSGPDIAYDRDRALSDILADQARRTPQASALVFGAESLTYRELDARAGRLAQALAGMGAGSGSLVALCAKRSLGMLVGLLAILKSGAAYLPLDPSFPAERQAFMLEDSGAGLLLAQGSLGARLPSHCGATLWMDETGEVTESRPAPAVGGTPANLLAGADPLAYVLYTSGSTGRPKGVMVTQRNVASFFAAMDQVLGPETGTWLAVTSISFDISVLELLWTLARGFRVVVLSEEDRLGRGDLPVLEQIRRQRVTHLQCTPSFARVLAALPEAPAILRPLRRLLVGGEALPPDLAQGLSRMTQGEVLNMYGPTETTVWSAFHRVPRAREAGAADAADAPAGAVAIGRPIANTRIHILDPRLEPVPAGMTGDIHIGGDGVAAGYLGRPELTRERFIADPFRPGARLYATGDLGRCRSDGVIDFLGRSDNQVKLRGHRIELGELEAVMRQHPHVRECVAAVRTGAGGDARLVAYVVAAAGDAEPDWRVYLEAKLPPYLVPSAFVVLPRLPLTPNGKIDRRALPDPGSAAQAAALVAPRNQAEERLALIWESVLAVPRIGVDDNFFERGGHSLLAVRLAALVGRAFGTRLPLAAIYEAPTVAKLAALLERGREAGAPGPDLVAIQPRGSKPPLCLVHGIGGGMMWGYANLARHLGQDQPLYAFKSRGLDGSSEPATIAELAAHYVGALRRFQPQGPYRIGGYCFGGNVAFEMACMLAAEGERVELLALFNAFPPNASFGRMRATPSHAWRFLRNLGVLALQFARGEVGNRRDFLKWKIRRLLGGLRPSGGAGADPDRFVDVRAFPRELRHVLAAHAHALELHRNRRYPGAVTLFRTRDFPTFCSFAPDFGWGEFAAGGVDVRIIPGKHDRIMEEPHVLHLAREVAWDLGS
jgi:amino acid adenylation domain-containing protein